MRGWCRSRRGRGQRRGRWSGRRCNNTRVVCIAHINLAPHIACIAHAVIDVTILVLRVALLYAFATPAISHAGAEHLITAMVASDARVCRRGRGGGRQSRLYRDGNAHIVIGNARVPQHVAFLALAVVAVSKLVGAAPQIRRIARAHAHTELGIARMCATDARMHRSGERSGNTRGIGCGRYRWGRCRRRGGSEGRR